MESSPLSPPPMNSEASSEFNLTEFVTSITTKIRETVNLELIQSFFNQDSILTQWTVAVISILLTLIVVCAFVLFGWWIVWKCFLSRFKFVRELLLGNNTVTTPTEETAPAPPSRNKRPKRKTRTE